MRVAVSKASRPVDVGIAPFPMARLSWFLRRRSLGTLLLGLCGGGEGTVGGAAGGVIGVFTHPFRHDVK